MNEFVICADGACSGNPGPGGYAWIIFDLTATGEICDDTEIKSGAGSSIDTTNNIMEMRAALDALSALDEMCVIGEISPGEVRLRFDSEYVLKGIFEWLPGWKKRDWKNAAGKPVKNREIWEKIDHYFAQLKWRGFTFKKEWVKGHAGDYGNERVDAKAVEMRDQAKIDLSESAGLGTPESNAFTEKMVDHFFQTGEVLEREAAPETAPKANGVDLMALAEAAGAETHDGDPAELARGKTANGGEITNEQVRAMKKILTAYEDGDLSVKEVIGKIRGSAKELGLT